MFIYIAQKIIVKNKTIYAKYQLLDNSCVTCQHFIPNFGSFQQ